MKLQRFPTILASLAALTLLAACGSDSKTGAGANGDGDAGSNSSGSAEESYHFTVNGCDTGKQSFTSGNAEDTRKKLCDALEDDRLNNYCAQSARQDYFATKCSGTFASR